MSEMFELG